MPPGKDEYRFAHERLKKAREDSRMTVERLAQLVNVPVESIEAWESGEEEPLGSQLARVGLVLHRPMSRFIVKGGK